MAKETTGAAVAATTVAKKKGIIKSADDIHDLYAQCNDRVDVKKDRSKQKIQVTPQVFKMFNGRTRQQRKYRNVPIEVVEK